MLKRRDDFGHTGLPAGARRHHPPGREGRQGAARCSPPRTSRSAETAVVGVIEADLRAAYSITAKADRYKAVDAATRQGHEALFRPKGTEPRFSKEMVAEAFHDLQAKVVRWNILDNGHPHRRPRPQDRAPDRGGSRHPAARARLGAVHPRRDAGAGGGDARHRRGRAVHRQPGRHLQGALPAALQLPSLLGGRDRPHGLAGPSRDRPRQARLARDPPDAADRGRVPLHDPHRVGDHRVERLLLDGDRVRLLAGADGCRRAAEAADGRHRHGPDPGGRALRGAVRHPGRRGSPRRHGLQGGRHRSGHHLAADGHQDHRHQRGDHAGRPRPGQGRPPAHPRRDVQGADRRACGTGRVRPPHRDHEDPPPTRSAK